MKKYKGYNDSEEDYFLEDLTLKFFRKFTDLQPIKGNLVQVQAFLPDKKPYFQLLNVNPLNLDLRIVKNFLSQEDETQIDLEGVLSFYGLGNYFQKVNQDNFYFRKLLSAKDRNLPLHFTQTHSRMPNLFERLLIGNEKEDEMRVLLQEYSRLRKLNSNWRRIKSFQETHYLNPIFSYPIINLDRKNREMFEN